MSHGHGIFEVFALSPKLVIHPRAYLKIAEATLFFALSASAAVTWYFDSEAFARHPLKKCFGYDSPITVWDHPPASYFALPLWLLATHFYWQYCVLHMQRTNISAVFGDAWETGSKLAHVALIIACMVFPIRWLAPVEEQPLTYLAVNLLFVIARFGQVALDAMEKSVSGVAAAYVAFYGLTCVAFIAGISYGTYSCDDEHPRSSPLYLMLVPEVLWYACFFGNFLVVIPTESLEINTTVTTGIMAQQVKDYAFPPSEPSVPAVQQLRRARTHLIHDSSIKYEALIFEGGGGAKSMAYAGALKRLEEAGILHGIKKFGGTSAGSHVAVMAACGYTGTELAALSATTPWTELIDMERGGRFSTVRNIMRILKTKGACKGDALEKFMDDLIKKKLGKEGVTFKELYDMTGCDVRIGVSDVVTRGFEYLTKDAYPNLSVAKGIRASTAIPLLFPPVLHEDRIFVDGGLVGQLPIKAFPGCQSLAFTLHTASDDADDADPDYSKASLLGYLQANADMLFSCAQHAGGDGDAHKKRVTGHKKAMQEHHGVSVVEVDCGDCSVFEAEMTAERAANIVEFGYKSIDRFLTGKD